MPSRTGTSTARPVETPRPPAPPPRPERTREAQPERRPDARQVDGFDRSGGRAGYGAPLDSNRQFQLLPQETRDRAHELEAGPGASRAAHRNLESLTTSRGFGQLTPERQRQMLDVYARHPEDRRVSSELTHLANSRAFREADPAAQQQQITDAGIPRRLRSDAVRVMNTTEPQHITVNGQPIDVYGANADELETIRNTLGRLPPEHLRTIPRVVVGDTVGYGSGSRGGAWVNQRAVDHYAEGAPGNAAAMRAEGWTDQPRLELTHESLNRPSVRESHVSPTVLHETGHAVDQAYGLSRGVTAADLGNVTYHGRHRSAGESRGPVMERFADAYMLHYLGTLRDPAASRTIDTALQQAQERAHATP